MNKEKNEKNYTKLYDKKGALIEIGSVISPVSKGHKKYVVVSIGNDDVPNIETFIIPKNINKFNEGIINEIDCSDFITFPKITLENKVNTLNFSASKEQVDYLLEEHNNILRGAYQNNKEFIELKKFIKNAIMLKENVEERLPARLSNLAGETQSDDLSIVDLYKQIYGEEKYNQLFKVAHNICQNDYSLFAEICKFDIDSMMIVYLLSKNLIPNRILKSRNKKFKPDPIYKRTINKQNHYSPSIDREVMKMKEAGYSTIDIIHILENLANLKVVYEFIDREKLITKNNERAYTLRSKFNKK